jgi:hypothetical protein
VPKVFRKDFFGEIGDFLDDEGVPFLIPRYDVLVSGILRFKG